MRIPSEANHRTPAELPPGTPGVENTRRRAEVLAAGLYLVFFAVGTAGHYLEITRELMLSFTPYVLLLLGLSTLLPFVSSHTWPVLVWVGATYVVTFALEAIGVATGVVFGEYLYGPVLGPKLLDVPVIIGFNWVIVVLGSVVIARWVVSRVFGASPSGPSKVAAMISVPLLVGLLAVGFDLVLEPVAMSLDYWQWTGNVVPVRNYIAWFVIAAMVSVPWSVSRIHVGTRLPAIYVVVQFAFILSLLPMAG